MADREDVERLTRGVADLYAGVEVRIVESLGRRLASGMGAPDWQTRKLAEIGAVRRFVLDLLRTLGRGPLLSAVDRVVTEAWESGGADALREVGEDGPPRGVGTAAVTALAQALTGTLSATHLQVLRWSEDVYRQVVATGGAADVLAGAATRRAASQQIWGRLLRRGVTGFRDGAGRNWDLASYVEMATRTTVAHSLVEGHLTQLDRLGVDLVIVSNSPQECRLCRPWEGRVLSRSGPPGSRTVQAESSTTGEPVSVRVAGSLAEARGDGLFHPNCTHRVHAYLPGATRIPKATANPEGDRARQRLRTLERRLRAAKLQQAGALDPAARKAYGERVRALQGQIREHVRDTGLIRQPARERIGAAR